MAPFRGALVGGALQFFGSDSFYHMRRILYTFDHFPSALWFDSYLDYPRGLELLWPPLFDQLVAGVAHLLGAETQRDIEIVASVVPPILGSLTILPRCHLYDCREMSHLRLIYESEPPEGSPNQVKIFERVVGARIAGTSMGGEAVVATLNLTTDHGRRFQYTKTVTPENGRYEMIVPYSTEEEGPVRAAGPYIVSSGGRSRSVDVAIKEVLRVGEVAVDL